MLTRNLYEEILLDPAKQGADNLYIVSGYASPSMVEMHMSSIRDILEKKVVKKIAIHLVIGMVRKGGITKKDHEKFRDIVRKPDSRFQCYYITKGPPVHSKVYVWRKGKACKFGFSGSANYTKTGFSLKQQKEAMEISPCEEALAYYNSVVQYGCPCVHKDADGLVKGDAYVEEVESTPLARHHGIEASWDGPFTVCLLNKSRVPHSTSWLNWGQRKGRNPNQAYIGLPTGGTSTTNEFFPARGVPFIVHTDDRLVFECSRCQDGGKAIHTPINNAYFGEYFRKRLKLKSGAPVTLDALLKYGRTDIKFYKIDEGEYYMDFSPRKP